MTAESLGQFVRFIWNHDSHRGRLSSRLRAVCVATAWQVFKHVTHRPIIIRAFDGMQLRCYPDRLSSASGVIYFRGRPDYHEMEFMVHYLRPGDAFVDVGANIGVYTLLAASLVGSRGAIDAFEPSARARERLRENLALNGLTWVQVHATAVASESGTARFIERQAHQRNRLAPRAADAKEVENATDVLDVVEVPCVRLDDVLGHRRYAMGKMDIEGGEPLALAGAERLLADANPPVWQLELHHGLMHAYGFCEEEFVDWLAEREYDIAVYDANARELHYGRDVWQLGRSNVLAIARSARDHVASLVRASR